MSKKCNKSQTSLAKISSVLQIFQILTVELKRLINEENKLLRLISSLKKNKNHVLK